MENKKDKDIDPAALPQKEVFESKNVFQHKSPADSGQPLEKETGDVLKNDHLKENEKTSKEPGLNE